MAKEIAEEYASSLADLTMNSKPLINMLTILAEENIDHAGVIVETVEKHLEKVNPEIKLPVLYLIDSIIKNVGGAYTQKFSQSIVNMFTRTFKQVDEKIRSQMFKLRETWHDVFPATKLYQLDVKVNLIDPAWPIQAQPQPTQSNIHVNPNFLKKTTPTTSTAPTLTEEEEKMRSILAKKEQELLMLQRKKIEMELEQTRKQLEMAEKNAKKLASPVMPPPVAPPVNPVIAMVNPVVAPMMAVPPENAGIPVKARLGPPPNKGAGGRIAPVSAALAGARRDPRLARGHAPPAPAPAVALPPLSVPAIAPNVFDIKPLERVTKRKNVITFDVRPEPAKEPRRRDPRLFKRTPTDRRRDRNVAPHHRRKDDERKRDETNGTDAHIARKDDDKSAGEAVNAFIDKFHIADPKKINKLPPIPKINREEAKDKETGSPSKKKKEIVRVERKKKRDSGESGKDSSNNSSPDKKQKTKEVGRKVKSKERRGVPEEKPTEPEVVAFKELKNYHKERYMRRNKEKSESPEVTQDKTEEDSPVNESSSKISFYVNRMRGRG